MSFPNTYLPALRLLLQASEYAAELGRDPWDFAVEIACLRQVGLTNSDLRWLICKGFVDHAVEATEPGENERSFLDVGKLTLGDNVCFVFTKAGVNALGGSAPNGHPIWHRRARELRLGEQLVKQFKMRAPVQEAILNAFEEEHWPPRIDDPLPPRRPLDSQERLHEAIRSLNLNQITPLVRFLGDGTGCGIRWTLRPPISHPQLTHISPLGT